jgi:PIN domain nuclease of toxin-antitoxin system
MYGMQKRDSMQPQAPVTATRSTFLWWITDDPQLSHRVREIIRDARNDLFLSAASGWEMAIKAQLGKLDLPGNLEGFIQDPFDRMLIAQAQMEKLSILTADPQLGRYEVETIW